MAQTTTARARGRQQQGANGAGGRTVANGSGWKVPKTKTSTSVYIILLALEVLGIFLLCALFGPWFLNWGMFWGVIGMLCITLAITNTYTETVPGFYARILLNQLTGKPRTIFQGFHFKLPWESITRDVDLKTELNDVCKDETYTAQDALMKVKYVYTLKPDVSGDKAGEKVIRYASFEGEAIKQGCRAYFSRTLSDYFADRKGEDLLHKAQINKDLFGPGGLRKVQKEYGVIAKITLEDVDFDERAQKFRDMVSGAESFDKALEILINRLGKEEGTRVAKLLNLEGVTEWNLNVHAPDLKNLSHVNFVGAPGTSSGNKKKGGNQ